MVGVTGGDVVMVVMGLEVGREGGVMGFVIVGGEGLDVDGGAGGGGGGVAVTIVVEMYMPALVNFKRITKGDIDWSKKLKNNIHP